MIARGAGRATHAFRLGCLALARVQRVVLEEGNEVPVTQSSEGAITRAKLLRARFKRLFTVPRLHPVISAISS